MFSIDLSGTVAMVTGGSRGIGRAAAVALATAGCDVCVVFASDEEAADSVRVEVEARGRRCLLIRGDVSDAEFAHEATSRAEAELGPIDVLVNSAGIVQDDLFLLYDDAKWRRVLDVNFFGVVHMTRAVVRAMWVRKRGRIINLSSVVAGGGGKGQSSYAASKGAVEALTSTLAVELAPRNIRVNCIAPGTIETDMTESLDRDALLARQLVKRFGRPEEIAAFVVLLASSYGDFATGRVFAIDGGYHLV